ncbi:ATP-binding protein [Desulfonatronum lacustre]|uniref:ATP-binding protein n=1 Tax=Desulfonatronum lacustre TaxID=66849 RepID=UPI00048CAEEA|nr:ATP-binding protein [Desulfonatronum lacustre]
MLDNETLQHILDDWSDWSRRPADMVPRTLVEQCVLTPEVVTVIQGVRRCGKSTLLRQLMTTNRIPKERAVFINFEDPRLVNDLDSALLEQIIQLVTGRAREQLTFFLDEIQNVANWQKWLNTQLETKSGHCFVVTGSNSQLLGGELASSLTGRHLRHELFPFDFTEFQNLGKPDELEQFIRLGGFPAVLGFPQPEKLLQQYFLDIVEKDIRERVSARSSRPLQAVAKMVLESVGSALSLRRIAGALQLSPETVSHYLQACEDAYLTFSCSYFAYSEAKRVRHNRKYYAIDTGLRRAISTRVGQDLGKDFENLVYLTLRRKTTEISYWKGKGEVDFVVNTPAGITPIQVTYGEPQQRHDNALEEFYHQFPHANEAIYVTPESFEELLDMKL